MKRQVVRGLGQRRQLSSIPCSRVAPRTALCETALKTTGEDPGVVRRHGVPLREEFEHLAVADVLGGRR
ncbi:hypothetical protein OG292_16975 [Streptomyces sp. NBC_01511]|uniref:hypothetical protein n=1 Tax=unclassified Streptomyces TaxID=2593676 RepID=UPI003864E8AD